MKFTGAEMDNNVNINYSVNKITQRNLLEQTGVKETVQTDTLPEIYDLGCDPMAMIGQSQIVMSKSTGKVSALNNEQIELKKKELTELIDSLFEKIASKDETIKDGYCVNEMKNVQELLRTNSLNDEKLLDVCITRATVLNLMLNKSSYTMDDIEHHIKCAFVPYDKEDEFEYSAKMWKELLLNLKDAEFKIVANAGFDYSIQFANEKRVKKYFSKLPNVPSCYAGYFQDCFNDYTEIGDKQKRIFEHFINNTPDEEKNSEFYQKLSRIATVRNSLSDDTINTILNRNDVNILESSMGIVRDSRTNDFVLDVCNNPSDDNDFVNKVLKSFCDFACFESSRNIYLDLYDKNQYATKLLLKLNFNSDAAKRCFNDIPQDKLNKILTKLNDILKDKTPSYFNSPIYFDTPNEPNWVFKINNTQYCFDKQTGELTNIRKNDDSNYNLKTKTEISHLTQRDGNSEVRRIIINKENGKEISEETFLKSVIPGEYEIWETSPDGRKSLIGLAEIDKNSGKHIEKTLKAYDGSKTDYAYADDITGNKFLYYKITDNGGNTTYQTKKTRKVLSENHFVTTNNDKSYDVEFKEDKVVVTKLDDKNEKTSEVVEYKIKDFTEAERKEVDEKFQEYLDNHNMNIADDISYEEKIIKCQKDKEYLHSLYDKSKERFVDKKLLPVLKQLSGDEWFSLCKQTDFIANNNSRRVQNNACSMGGAILMSDNFLNEESISALEHEIGHEKFFNLDLINDKELLKIYNEERNNFMENYPTASVMTIDYFLFRNEEHMRGLNETTAETNQLINVPQGCDRIKDRSIILQQFFPRTIAYIANKYDNY